MTHNPTKTLATLALAIQALGVMLAVVVIFMQDKLLPLYMGHTPEKKGIVFPVALLTMVVQLVIYLVFVCALQNRESEKNVVLCVILVVVSVLFSLASTWIETFGVIIYSKLGAETLARYSGVTNMVSYVRQACCVPAVALFYLACGRYTVKAE